ncbi:Crp/Fnr family transcriptional regulator [Clostridium estertheticum]|uniref:Crp/Fnr family transcriptional regulator n=1 Tax=Clostridium estertheticum TaxID=238834 RepID=UPI001C0E4516|nr:Crp/Fnr family transcriptional regulator [Clostridium estertheticum]MBU3215806.1 Crp/Fnr family transcriptional regulator [Clostridium estertheticum]WAG57764.1 Crp/Fnr family transcriptional regulator [Clostridium estertheticum]
MEECNCENCNHSLCAKKVPIFSFLSDDELTKIVGMTGHKVYKKGDMLCSLGAKSDTLFIINEGQVKISKLTKEGKQQIVHIFTSGDFFGELSLFSNDEIYTFDAYAISNVKICTLTKQDMDRIIMSNPEISLKLLQVISKRLTQTENLAQNLATNDVEIRIAFMLLEFADMYGVTVSQGLKINLPINREEMANYVGVTRETISRKLSIFEELGIISLNGNKVLIIKQIDMLRAYVE